MDKIFTERLELRKLELNDAQAVFEILTTGKTAEYLNIPEINEVEDARQLISEYLAQHNKKEAYPFAIIYRKTGKLIGVFDIKLDIFDEDCFEYTVYIHPDFWNMGINTEVLPLMTDYALNVIKTGNFRGFIMQSNRASAKVLTKCGFKLEKVFEVPGLKETTIESYLMTKEEFLNK